MKSSALKRFTQKSGQCKDSEKKVRPSHAASRQCSIMTKKPMKSMPSEDDTISYEEKEISKNYHDSRRRMNSLPVSLPRLEEQIAIQEKKALQQIYTKKPNKKLRYELLPLKKLQPVRLMKRSTSSNSGASYLSMASSRRKLTDQLFSQLQNIKLVQRLLLAQPSKQNSKNEHQQFYKQQNQYKKNIQLSKSVPFKSKKTFFNSKPWNS